MMKKLLILVMTFGLFSCSNDSTPVETEILKNVFVIPQGVIKTETDIVKHIEVQKKAYLWDVAEMYLGNGYRYMEIANLNYEIFQDFDRYRITGKNPRWSYGEVRVGEIIILPADAYGLDVQETESTYSYIKAGYNLNDFFHETLKKVVDSKDNRKDVIKDSSNNNISALSFGWSEDFLKALAWCLGVLIALLLMLMIVKLIQRLWNSFFNKDTTSITESTTHSKVDCCDEIKNDIASLSKQSTDYHQKQMEEISKIKEDSKPSYDLEKVIEELKKEKSTLGFTTFKIDDQTNKVKIEYMQSELPAKLTYSKVGDLVYETFGEIYEEDRLAEVTDYLYENFGGKDNEALLKILEDAKSDILKKTDGQDSTIKD